MSTQAMGSPTSQARAKLEQSQLQLYQTSGLPVPPAQSAEALVESYAAKIAAKAGPKIEEISKLLAESPPTAYENLTQYINILLVANRLEKAATAADPTSNLSRPIFGTIPVGAINAVTIREGNEYVVALSTALFAFGELVARCIAKTVTYSSAPGQGPSGALWVFDTTVDAKAIHALLKQHPEVPTSFANALLSYATLGRPDTSQAPALDDPQTALATVIYRYFLEFVVAHEYGHIIQGHLSSEPRGDLTWDWEKEAEADVAACGLMFATALVSRANVNTFVLGIEVFLGSYELLDRALSVLCFGEEDHWWPERHPPAKTRRSFLARHLISRAGEFVKDADAAEIMTAAFREASWLQRPLDCFWDLARPWLWRLYEVGTPAAPIFGCTSDATQTANPAVSGEGRLQLDTSFPSVAAVLKRAESLLLSARHLMRSGATAAFNGERATPGQLALETRSTIPPAMAGFGAGLESAAIALASLVPVPQSAKWLSTAGSELKTLASRELQAETLREAARRLQKSGALLSFPAERTGIGKNLILVGEALNLAGAALAMDMLLAFTRLTKLAGALGVVAADVLVRAAIESWRLQVLRMLAAACASIAADLRSHKHVDLDGLRDSLGMYKEAAYAVRDSLRRTAAFLQNVSLPQGATEVEFRRPVPVLNEQAVAVGHAASAIGAAESALRQSESIALPNLFESASKSLSEAAILDPAIGEIAARLSAVGKLLLEGRSLEAAALLEIAWR